METEKKRVTVFNLGQGTHIFGAAFVHPYGDSNKQPVCICPLQELGPKGTPKEKVEFTIEQFRLYEDDSLRNRVDSREFAVLLDGKDVRPDLARRDAAKAAALAAKTPTPATESAATKEASVLAEILAEGNPKPE